MEISFTDISRMSLFRSFDDKLVKMLDMFFQEQNYATGHLIVEEGRRQDRFFVLFAGEVEAYHDLGGKRVVLDTLSAGQFFGEMNLFDPGTATASIRSLTPVRTLEISNEQFVQFMRYKPEAAADFMFQLTQIIVKRLRNTTENLTQALMSPENLKRAVQIDRGLPA